MSIRMGPVQLVKGVALYILQAWRALLKPCHKLFNNWTTDQIFMTVTLFMHKFGWGLFHGMWGPALLDLQLHSHTNTAQFATSISLQSVGGFLAVPLGGLIMDRVDYHIFLGTSCGINAAVIATYAFLSTNYNRLMLLSILLGVSDGFIACGINVATLMLWGYEGAFLIAAINIMFGLGSTLSPWIVAPFISTTPNQNQSTICKPVNSQAARLPKTNSPFETMPRNQGLNFDKAVLKAHGATPTPDVICQTVIEETQIQYAYVIVSIFFASVAVMYCFSYRLSLKSKASIEKQPTSNGTKNGNKNSRPFEPTWYRQPMIMITLVRFACIVGVGSQFFNFLVALAVKEFSWTKPRALGLASLYQTVFTASRMAWTFITVFISPPKIIIINVILMIGSLMFLSLGVNYGDWVLWFGACGFALTSAPLYGASLATAERHIVITGFVGSILTQGNVIGVFIFSMLIGYLFDSVPISMVFICIGGSIVLGVFFVIACRYSHYYEGHMKKVRSQGNLAEMM